MANSVNVQAVCVCGHKITYASSETSVRCEVCGRNWHSAPTMRTEDGEALRIEGFEPAKQGHSGAT